METTQRKYAKATVTRRINVVKALIKNQSPVDEVASADAKVKESFDKFKTAHTQFKDSLKEESDKDQAEEYYVKVEQAVQELEALIDKYTPNEEAPLTDDEDTAETEDQADEAISSKKKDGENEAKSTSMTESRKKKFLAKAQILKKKKEIEKMQLELDLAKLEVELDGDNVDQSIGQTLNSTMRSDISESVIEQQQKMIDMLQAPKAELKTFDGDPLKYWTFIRSFESNVHDVLSDPAARLTRLIQYTTDEAEDAISSCTIMEPSHGYETAREILKDRFGNNFVIAKAWLDKITSGKGIRVDDPLLPKALRKLSDDTKNCKITLDAMGPEYVIEMNSQNSILKIVTKLPGYLKARWRKEAVDLQLKHGRLPRFEDVVNFLAYAAVEANNSIYGSIMTPEKKKEPQSRQRATTFATKAGIGNKQNTEKASAETSKDQ